MGRSGRVALRICSTLEIRTHATSSPTSAVAAMALALPSPSTTTTVVALSNKTTLCSSPLTPSPMSPDTPGQTLPANVQPQQAWPLELLQLMQRQIEVLNSHNNTSGGGGGGTKRKHDYCAVAAAIADDQGGLPLQKEDLCEEGGNDVELHAQSPLPDDWEQFLDLETHELYYMHGTSCKRAKRDPRELVRQAEKFVRALVSRAHARFAPNAADFPEPDTSSTAASSSSSDVDTCASRTTSSETTTDSACSEASSSSQVANGEVESVHCSDNKKEKKSECEEESSDKEATTNATTRMVALGCSRCSTFVMLSLSYPCCPSCGETSLHAAAEDDDRDG